MTKYFNILLINFLCLPLAYAMDDIVEDENNDPKRNIHDPTQPFWMKNEYKKDNKVETDLLTAEEQGTDEKSAKPAKDVTLIDQIIYSGSFRRVRMGGDTLSEGDIVQGYKILHIKPTSVVLTNGKEEKSVDIFKPSIKSYR
ncbi:MAG: hypothetical protein V4629_05260 [Pseudomonadota bacterium]